MLSGLPGAAGRFFAWYFHDILAGAMILSLVNLLLSAGRLPPLIRALPAAAFLLGCGLFWEYGAPRLIAGSVSDPLDLLAYLAGGLSVLPLLRAQPVADSQTIRRVRPLTFWPLVGAILTSLAPWSLITFLVISILASL